MSGRSEFKAYYQALISRLGRGGRGLDGDEARELHARHEEWTREFEAAGSPAGTVGDMNYFLERPPAWELVAVELGLDRAPVRSATGRRRSPDPIPITTVKRLIVELARRRDTENPRRGPLTQTGIAQRLGIDYHRVQQAEGLVAAGWDLLRSHPDHSAEDGYVRWPSVAKARDLLGSEPPTQKSPT